MRVLKKVPGWLVGTLRSSQGWHIGGDELCQKVLDCDGHSCEGRDSLCCVVLRSPNFRPSGAKPSQAQVVAPGQRKFGPQNAQSDSSADYRYRSINQKISFRMAYCDVAGWPLESLCEQDGSFLCTSSSSGASDRKLFAERSAANHLMERRAQCSAGFGA